MELSNVEYESVTEKEKSTKSNLTVSDTALKIFALLTNYRIDVPNIQEYSICLSPFFTMVIHI